MIHAPVQVGWLCPQCHRVNAPFAMQCTCRPAVWTEPIGTGSSPAVGGSQIGTKTSDGGTVTGFDDNGRTIVSFPKTSRDPLGLGPRESSFFPMDW